VGIVSGENSLDANSQIVNLITNSKKSMKINYHWDVYSSEWLIRIYLSGGNPRNVMFDNSYIMQAYIFGDGSGNAFRFSVDDKVPNAAAENHEVSPWYTIDWIGWKLISWDMTNDSTGTWLGDGQLDGTLRYDSIQMTYNHDGSEIGTIYVDDLRLVKKLPVSVEQRASMIPKDFALYQNYPNPFNPKTTIRYRIADGSQKVTITIFDLLGKEVRTLVNERKYAGDYVVDWDGKDENGIAAASGIYIYRINAGKFKQSRRMVFMK